MNICKQIQIPQTLKNKQNICRKSTAKGLDETSHEKERELLLQKKLSKLVASEPVALNMKSMRGIMIGMVRFIFKWWLVLTSMWGMWTAGLKRRMMIAASCLYHTFQVHMYCYCLYIFGVILLAVLPYPVSDPGLHPVHSTLFKYAGAQYCTMT